MNLKKVLLFVLISILLITTVGCKEEIREEAEKKIIIAEQFGLAYAPIQIMKEKNFLSDRLENYNIEWTKFANSTAIREAVLADSLDLGFMGIPPFIIGYENGMDWKIFSGLSTSPLGLVTNDENIKSIKDIQETDRIIVPQPGSIQHILLSMAAEKELGDAKYFDDQLISMKHPDGMSVILSEGEASMHFTSPPYLFQELDGKETSLVISGDECFGDEFTFIVGMATRKFKEDETAYKALEEAINDAIVFINNNQEETIEILSNYYDYDIEVLTDYVYNSNIGYSTEVKGIPVFVEFMKNNGYIESEYSVDDLQW